VLERLAADETLRRRMGEAALAYVRSEHDLGRAADLYVAALEEAAGRPALDEAVLGRVARAAADIGYDPDGPEVGELAGRIREVGLGG
jgi:hypothetical protein